MIEIDCLVLGHCGAVDQFIGQLVVEVEATLHDRMQLVALARRHVAVDAGGVHQQRHRREAIVVVGKLARMLVAFNKFSNEISNYLNMGLYCPDGWIASALYMASIFED